MQVTFGVVLIVKEIFEFFYACGAFVLEGYGMIEILMVIMMLVVFDYRFGIVGCVIFGVEVKIAGDGEILVRGLYVFKGYYGSGDTVVFGVVEVDGWLYMGDFGSFDEDGYLLIIGCKKDLIITVGGKNLMLVNFENDFKILCWIF